MREKATSIHVFFEAKNKSAKIIVDEIYTQFSFPNDNILSPSIGCSICLYGSVAQLKTYDYETKADLYIFIATSDMGRNVQEYINVCNNLYDNGCQVMIISLVENKYFFDAKNFSINTYMLKETLIEKEKFKLMCIIAQKLTREKVCLFFSYYRDEGSAICNKFKEALSSTPGFHEFMDVKDIEFGAPIQEEIEKHLDSSVVICFSTDEYSERFWGTKELLFAKRNSLPIVVVDCLKSIEKRRNPNSGNMPVVRIDQRNFEEFVYKTVLLALKEKLRMLEAKKYHKEDKNILCLWKAPELYDIKKAEKAGKTTVMYPAPPICQCETEYYSMLSDVQLVLDNNLQQISKTNKKICVSFSNTELNPHIHPYFFDSLLNEIIRYSIYGEYQLLYGGDWRDNGLTEKILDYYKIYQSRNGEHIDFLINYFANLEEKDINIPYSKIRNFGDIKEFVCADIPKEKQVLEKPDLRAELLSTMRKEMIKDSDAIIVFGGKERGCVGYTSGIAEEISIAYSLRKPIYLLGSVGGATTKIIRIIEGSDEAFPPSFIGENACNNTANINRVIKSIKVENLSRCNGLSVEENKKLFNSIDLREIIRLVFSALSKTL